MTLLGQEFNMGGFGGQGGGVGPDNALEINDTGEFLEINDAGDVLEIY